MKTKKFALKMNLQTFAGNRMTEINERVAEIRTLLEGDTQVDLDAIDKELRSLTGEKAELEKRASALEGIRNGTAEFRTLDTQGGLLAHVLGAKQGQSSPGPVTVLEDGSRLYRSNQRIADVYPNKENLGLGKYLRGAITGNWKGAENEQREFRSLSTATASVLIPEVLSAQVIDLARNKSILFQSGVQMAEMTSNNLTISRVKSDPTFSFKAEGAATTEQTMEFEGVLLKAKTIYGLVSVTLEAINSSSNLESVVLNAMSESIARTIDSKCLFGSTVDEPKGILTYAEINEQAETAALAGYSPFVKAIGKVRRANGEPTAWALNATTDEDLNLFVNSQGDPMQIPQVVQNLQRMVSNQLPNNGGTGTDESTAIIYDPNAIVIGMQTQLSIEVSREALDAWKNGLVYLRVYAMLDVALQQPKHICKITGLK